MKRLFFFLIPFSLMLACTPVASDDGTDDASATDTTPPPVVDTTHEDADWAIYWKKFQAAVAKDDMDAIAALTHFGDRIDEEHFQDNHAGFFTEELKEVIANTKAADVEITDDGSDDYPDYRSVWWEETVIVEGEEYGSALFLYFGKVDGRNRLVGFLAAG